MSVSPQFISWKMAYQVSPIILTNGIAANQGNALPIVTLTDPNVSGIAASASLGVTVTSTVTGAGTNPELDGFFANYVPLPGSSLINNQIAMYPFANQAVAANAIITQPLNIALLMTCPAGPAGSYYQKQTTMMSLQSSLAQHNGLGGTYSIITPAFIFTDCIMTGMRDVSSGNDKQVQYQWQLDFLQPLVTTQAAAQAQNNLNRALTAGTPPANSGSISSSLPVGNPTSLLTSSSVPIGPP